MKVLCVFTKYNYGDKQRGISIEYAAFIPALRELGHDVRHIETWDAAESPTYADLNRHILTTVDEWRPDIFFSVQRDFEIWLETLDLIARASHVCTVTWATDDSFKFSHYSRFIGPHYDAIGTTYDYRLEDYHEAGIDGAFLTQWAANAEWLQAPKRASQCKYKVTFIGTMYGERAHLIDELKRSGIDVTCFGFGWPSGPVESDAIPRLMRDSVVSLNFSEGFRSNGGHNKQIKARTFEVPGAGGFLLTEYAPGLERYYRLGGEVETFRSPEELKAKLQYYLANPDLRDLVAAAGFERTRKEHVYTRRLQEIIEFAQSRTAHNGGRSQLRYEASKLRTDYNEPLRTWERLLRVSLQSFGTLIVGRKRGLKAARRFVFEASVRLVGKKTFTSRGLPGRLFPYV